MFLFCLPGLRQQEDTLQERQKSSEILEELLNQGIIPVGESRERGSGAGEAYSIMVRTHWSNRSALVLQAECHLGRTGEHDINTCDITKRFLWS